MKWVRIKAFAISYVKAFFRDKASAFWTVAWPLLILILTAYVFIPPSFGKPTTLKVGVVNKDIDNVAPFNGTSFIEMLRALEYNGTKLFNVVVYDNETSLMNDLNKGKLDVGMVIPKGFGLNLTYGQALLKVYVSGESTYDLQVNRVIISEFIHGFSREVAVRKLEMMKKYILERISKNVTINTPHGIITLREMAWNFILSIVVPINASIHNVAPKAVMDRPYLLGWYALGAIGMLLLYSGFNIGATTVVEEKEKGRLYRILSTPATEVDMLIGKTIGGLIVLSLSSLIIIVAAVTIVHARISWDPFRLVDWLVPLHFLLISLMCIGIGFILSLVAKTVSGASSISTILGLMLAFITGVWFPKSWLPKGLKVLADISPITWSLDVIRDIMIRRATLTEVALPTLKCIIITLMIFLLGVIAYRKAIRKYIEA